MKRLLGILGAIGLVWSAGFIAFVVTLPKAATGAAPAADGVVVYTGEGMRLTEAMAVFGAGSGRRLLISGVNPETSRGELSHLFPGDADRFDCCVDLGRAARSTRGNAAETEAWVSQHGFASVLLVTSDYHMPRAVTESRERMAAVEIIPYVTASGLLTGGGAPRDARAVAALWSEYNKYLVARIGSLF